MTLVTGTVQDLGYDGMDGTLWARPARFRSDGSVVLAPERKPFKITGGVVSAELAPGPAVLEIQVGSHARGTFEVVIPDTDISLADLLDAVFPWEPAQVSLFVAEREAAQQAKADAEQAKADAELAAQQTGQDRTAVAADKDTVVAHVQALAEPNDAAVLGLISEGADTATKAALNATYEPAGAVEDAVALQFGTSTAAQEGPNVALGGTRNGTGFASDVFGSTILNPGTTVAGNNNIIGGNGAATIGTPNLNVPTPGTNAIISVVGGYDCVAGQISSKIISDHSYTEPAPEGQVAGGHSAIFGGTSHVIRWRGGHAFIAGGRDHDVAGDHSLTSGYKNQNNNSTSAVSGGLNVVGTGQGCVVGGSENTVEDDVNFTNVSGFRNTVKAGAESARVYGSRAVARFGFTDVMSGGGITKAGDSQVVRAHYHRQNSTGTATQLRALRVGGNTKTYSVIEGQTSFVTARVIATNTSGSAVGAWTITAVAHWAPGAAGPTWFQSPVVTVVKTDGSTATAGMSMILGGSGVGQLTVTGTGIEGETINWSASFEAVEVMV